MLAVNQSTPLLTGLLLAFAASLFFSIKTIFIKLAYQYGVDTVSFITLRMLFAAPFYIAVALYLVYAGSYRALSVRRYIQVGLLGLCSYYLASVLDLEGLHYIGANLERMILYVYPTLTLLLGAVFLGRRITLLQILVIMLAYSGLGLVFWENLTLVAVDAPVYIAGFSLQAIFYGSLCVLLSALSYAIFVTFSQGAIAAVGAKQFTALAMLAASSGVAVHFVLSSNHSVAALMALPKPVYMHALAVAFICTVLPSFMLASAISIIGANNTGIVGMTGPIITLLAAALILAEPLGVLQIIGVAITLAAVFLLGKSQKYK